MRIKTLSAKKARLYHVALKLRGYTPAESGGHCYSTRYFRPSDGATYLVNFR